MHHPFVWQIRVYWEDTDAGGVVYHSNYLNFFERARTEWLRSLGISQSELSSDHNLVFAIRKMDIDFLAAARLDDELDVNVHSVQAGASRMTFHQEMSRRSDGKKLAMAQVTAACLAADSFKPDRIPAWIKARVAEQQ